MDEGCCWAGEWGGDDCNPLKAEPFEKEEKAERKKRKEKKKKEVGHQPPPTTCGPALQLVFTGTMQGWHKTPRARTQEGEGKMRKKKEE